MTPTASPTQVGTPPTATPTPTAAPRACLGDCDGGVVAINELILGVNIALGTSPLPSCRAFDANADGTVAIGELIMAVGNARDDCPT